MHQWDDAVFARLQRFAKDQGIPRIKDNLTHAMIFYTAGEAVRRAATGHAPYAEVNGLWRGAFGAFKPALDEVWKPYLDGQGTLDEALAALLRR